MWYLWLIVGLVAAVIFIKRYDGSRRESRFDSDWIGDWLSDFDGDSDGGIGD
jgi:hypothetical protein